MGNFKATGIPRVAPAAHPDERRPVPDHEPPPVAPGDFDDPDTMDDPGRGPARGIVLALGPALLVWAALIALVAKLV